MADKFTDEGIRQHVRADVNLSSLLNGKAERVGGLVRTKRLEAGIGQPELAVALGVSSAMVQHYETGRNALTAPKLVAIADKLGCKTTDLIP